MREQAGPIEQPRAEARLRAPTLRPARGFPCLLALSAPLLLFLVLPLLAIVLRASLPQILRTLPQSAVAHAVGLSLVTATITMALAVVLGTPLAYLLARYSFRGRGWVETLVEAPMVLPPAVAGVGLLLAFGRRGLLGGALADYGITLAFTQTAVVMAQLFVAAPFFIKSATAGFMELDRDLEQAAALDGASEWQAFRYVSAPLSAPALVGGAIMTWARALGEFGATILFAGNLPGRTQTMPLAIYLGFEVELNVALTLAVVLLVCSFTVLAITKGVLKTHLVVR